MRATEHPRKTKEAFIDGYLVLFLRLMRLARPRLVWAVGRPAVSRAFGLAAGLAIGTGLDAVLGNLRRGHPVAMFGKAASFAERRLWADNELSGVLFVVTCVGPVTALGWALDRLSRRSLGCYVAVTAVTTWAVLGSASLGAEGLALARSLEAGDLADRAAASCPPCAGATPRTRWTPLSCAGPSSSRWRRTPTRTPPSLRCCGVPCAGCPVCSATVP